MAGNRNFASRASELLVNLIETLVNNALTYQIPLM